ncbi:MAG: zinc carboxypeptidase, partial [Bacteroidetes bacterium]|nr:zinc carboxypeptidase [Bacteroidota bacterium]
MKLFVALSALILNAAFGRQSLFFPVGAVNPSVPSPSSILGYEIGDRFTDYRNLERYMERLSASSNRVKRIIYGETYEHRPLQLLVMSSPTNLAKMEEIRSSNLKLTDPRMVKPVEAGQIIEKNPVIVWLSYGVHGNESSSPEAAIATAYQLCAGTDPRTQSILENAIIIIDPSQNPDGRERYVRWVNSAASISPNTDPETYEHREPWPGGRTNHYYFDLNRDWAWQTQQET